MFKATFLPGVEECMKDEAIEKISRTLLMECNISIAYPERLWPCIVEICKEYHKLASEEEI